MIKLNTLTNLGKVLRKIRIDKDLLLGDMSKIFEISPAYLSAIELGKREITKDFVIKIQNCSLFSQDEIHNMKEAIEQDKI